MDDARRSELVGRRAALRALNARKDAVARLGDTPARLEAAGVAHRVHHPGDPAHLPALMRADPFELWISGRSRDGAGWLLEPRHPHVRGIG